MFEKPTKADVATQQIVPSNPLFQLLLPDQDFSSAVGLASARQYIVGLIVTGSMVDPPGQ